MSVTVGDHRSLGEADIEPDSISEILELVHKKLPLPPGDIEISLVDDSQIQLLNRDYRNKDCSTNVLSFPHYAWRKPGICLDDVSVMADPEFSVLWGEIIVSTQTVKRDADAADKPYFYELIRICIHGLLHLFGYDHHADSDFDEMSKMEQKGIDIALVGLEQKEL